MVVLGIDPGFTVTGFGVLKKDGKQVYLIDYGYLKLNPKDSLSTRIGIFYHLLDQKIKKLGVTHVSLETSFLGKNAQNFLKLGYLRGVLYLLADQNNLKISEFTPRQVKQNATGFGGASKDQVARAVCQLFSGFKYPDKQDVTDALAVSLCGLWN